MRRQTVLLISFFLLSIILLIVILVAQNLGKNYQAGLEQIQTDQNQQFFTRDKRRIRKVFVERDGKCLVIGEDAVVRTYDTCDGELQNIHRLADPKHVLELLEFVSRLDPSKYRQKPSGFSLKLIIQTDNGTEVIYIPVGGGGPDSIPDVIDLIEGDLPQPTQTPFPTIIPSPTLPGTTIIPSLTPTPTWLPGVSPTPYLTPTPALFICDYFDDPTDVRPYNVSSFLCSEEPR
jgi:hypothetical protein